MPDVGITPVRKPSGQSNANKMFNYFSRKQMGSNNRRFSGSEQEIRNSVRNNRRNNEVINFPSGKQLARQRLDNKVAKGFLDYHNASIVPAIDGQYDVINPASKYSYWENPYRIARYHEAIRNAPPGWKAPDWLDVQTVEAAYKYFDYRNEGKPWQEWKYLNEEDPAASWLRGIKPPPAAYLFPDELEELGRQEQIGAWDQLYPYQQVFQGIFATQPVINADNPTDRPLGNILLADTVRAGMSALSGSGLGVGAATLLGMAGVAAPWLPAGLAATFFIGSMYQTLTGKKAPVVGDVLSVFDVVNVLSAATERVVGVGEQVIDNDVETIMDHLDAAYKASEANYETNTRNLLMDIWTKGATAVGAEGASEAMITKPGEVYRWDIGKAEPQKLPAGYKTGIEALNDIREQIVAGGDSQEIIADYTSKFGIQGYLNDFLLQNLFDPLNVVQTISQKAGADWAARTGDPVLIKALQPPTVVNAAVDFLPMPLQWVVSGITGGKLKGSEGLLAGIRKYDTFIMTGLYPGFKDIPADYEPEKYFTQASVLAKSITKEGLPKYFIPAIDDTPKTKAGRFFKWLGELTPASKAKITFFNMADQLDRLFEIAGDDLDMVTRIAKNAGEVDPKMTGEALNDLLKPKTGEKAIPIDPRFYASPIGFTLAMGLKEMSTSKLIDEFYQSKWVLPNERRVMLYKAAALLEIKPGEVLERIAKGMDLAETLKLKAKEKGIQGFEAITNESVAKMFGVFSGDNALPIHPDQFKAEFGLMIKDQLQDYVVKRFGLKQDSTFMRIAHVLKAVQSLIVLGFNPGYLINNKISNVITKASVGIFGVMSHKNINDYMKRMNIDPSRYDLGFGKDSLAKAELGITPEGKIKNITKAIKGEKDLINSAQKVINDVNEGVGIFSKLAGIVERNDSKQAYVSALSMMYSNLWKRKVAIRPIPKDLATKLGSEVAAKLYEIAEGALNIEELNNNFYDKNRKVTATELLNRVIETFAINNTKKVMDTQVYEDLLVKTGVMQELDTRLKTAKTILDVDNAFAEVEGMIDGKVKEMMAHDLKTRAENIHNVAKNEGITAVIAELTDIEMAFSKEWVMHFSEWQDLYDKKSRMEKREFSQQVEIQRARDDSRFTRFFDWERETTLGVLEAMGYDKSNSYVKTILDSHSEVSSQWREFYKLQEAEGKALVSEKYDNDEAYQTAYQLYKTKVSEAAELTKEFELNEMAKQNEAYIALSKDPELARAWREEVTAIRKDMMEEMKTFRESLGSNPPETQTERNYLWNKFINERYAPRILALKSTEAMISKLAGQKITDRKKWETYILENPIDEKVPEVIRQSIQAEARYLKTELDQGEVARRVPKMAVDQTNDRLSPTGEWESTGTKNAPWYSKFNEEDGSVDRAGVSNALQYLIDGKPNQNRYTTRIKQMILDRILGFGETDMGEPIPVDIPAAFELGYRDSAAAEYDRLIQEGDPEAIKSAIPDESTEGKVADYWLSEWIPKNDVRTMFTDTGKYNDRQADSIMQVLDFRATRWATETGRKPGEWYNEKIKELKYADRPEDIANALDQELEKANLVAVHNLGVRELFGIDQLGGLPVSSIAVTKAGTPFSNYGDISLIGNRDMVDPEIYGNKVFDGDAYTKTKPREVWNRVKGKAAKAVLDKVGGFQNIDGWTSISNMYDKLVNFPDKPKAIEYLENSLPGKAAFLKEKGITIDPVMKVEDLSDRGYIIADNPELREYLSANHETIENAYLNDLQKTSKEVKEFARLYLAAVDKYWRQGKLKDIPERIRRQMVSESGELSFQDFDRATMDLGRFKAARKEVDRVATGKIIEENFTPELEAEYKQWVADTLNVFDRPQLELGGKRVHYNLDNIVEYMTRGKTNGAQDTMTFGSGQARAASARGFDNIDQMHKQEGRLVTDSEFSDWVDNTLKPLEENFRNLALDFYKKDNRYIESFDRTWDGLDDSGRVIANYLNAGRKGSPERMREMLYRYGFKDVTPETIQAGMELAEAIRNAPTEYFEAKPQRAVMLREFSGAVVPKDLDPKALEVLQKNGLEIKTYEPNDLDSRVQAVESFYGKPGVLFQKRQKLLDDIYTTGTSSDKWYYSQLYRTIEGMPNRMPADQLENFLKGRVKTEEMQDTGFDEFIKEAKAAGEFVEKTKAIEFLDSKAVRLEEVVYDKSQEPVYEKVRPNENYNPGEWVKNDRGWIIEDTVSRWQGNAYGQRNLESQIEYFENDKIYRAQPYGNVIRTSTLEEAQTKVIEAIRAYSYDQLVTYGKEPKYERYTIPGEKENYWEMLLMLPVEKGVRSGYKITFNGSMLVEGLSFSEAQNYVNAHPNSALEIIPIETNIFDSVDFQSSHWSEPNIVVSLRADDRIDADGKLVLHLEEDQSDLHEKGRDYGYKEQLSEDEKEKINARLLDIQKNLLPNTQDADIYKQLSEEQDGLNKKLMGDIQGVPNAPFKKSWADLGMRRIIRYAVENGYDRVTWSTGAQQSEMYSDAIQEQVDRLEYQPDSNKLYGFRYGNDQPIFAEAVEPQNLKDYVGKEISDQLLDPTNLKGKSALVEGVNIKVGSKGMVEAYDKRLVNNTNNLIRKWGSEVKDIDLGTGEKNKKYYAIYDEFGDILEDGYLSFNDAQEDLIAYKESNEENLEIHSYESDTVSENINVVVHGFDITEDMKKAVMQGLPLYKQNKDVIDLANKYGIPTATKDGKPNNRQLLNTVNKYSGQKYEKIEDIPFDVAKNALEKRRVEKGLPRVEDASAEVRGQVNFDKDGAAWIKVFETSDITTIVHEVGHIFRREIQGDDLEAAAKLGGLSSAEELTRLQQQFDNGTISEADRVRYIEAEEKFAEGFEQYLAGEHKHMPEQIQIVFRQFAQFLLSIWKNLVGQKKVDINATVMIGGKEISYSDIYDRLFANLDGRRPLNSTPVTLDQGKITGEIADTYLYPLFDTMKDTYRRNYEGYKPFTVEGVSDELRPEVQNWINSLKGDMASAKMASMKYAEQMRDEALLNYSKRTGLDEMLSVPFPYIFWYTKTMMNWAVRMLEKPALVATYARYRKLQERLEKEGIPNRLKGKMRIPAAYLPEWMGGGIWYDPMRQLFPFSQLLDPEDRAGQKANSLKYATYEEIDRLLSEQTISTTQAQEAKESMSGQVWDMASATAASNIGTFDPVSLASIMATPAMYITTPYYLANGQPEKIQTTPLQKFSANIDSVTDNTFLEGVGNLIGLPAKGIQKAREKVYKMTPGTAAFGEFGDYYIDRMLANMVGDGAASIFDARAAMVNRAGDTYAEALDRVKQEQALKMPGTLPVIALKNKANIAQFSAALFHTLFPAGLLPQGELEYLNLKDEYNHAWDMYNKGFKDELNTFFNDHPEFEARIALKDDPDERMRNFLISNIWDSYSTMDSANKQQAVKQLGRNFQDSFLNTETRSYESIPVETLASWAYMMSGYAPDQMKDVVEEVQPLDLFPADSAAAYEQYQSEIDMRFPNIKAVQTEYYNLPKSQRKSFLRNYPELKDYWEWNSEYKRLHPEIQAIVASKSAEYDSPPEFTAETIKGMPEELTVQLMGYAMIGKNLGAGAWESLKFVWERSGKPYGDLREWVDREIVPNFWQ